MAFPRVEPQYESGEQGEAQVKGNKKTVKLRPGRWYVRLSSDESEIYSYHPWSGNFKGKVAEFAAKEGEPPVPRLKDVDFYNDKGKHIKYSYYYFIVLIEILEPKKLAGLLVPHRLNYNFLEAKDEQDRSIVGLMSKGNRTKDLAEFLKITGADKGKHMKWKDNILPVLERRILRIDNSFNFIIKDGWIDTLYQTDEPDPAEDNWDEDDVPEEEPAEEDTGELDWDEE
jgi:hypothetical protein